MLHKRFLVLVNNKNIYLNISAFAGFCFWGDQLGWYCNCWWLFAGLTDKKTTTLYENNYFKVDSIAGYR